LVHAGTYEIEHAKKALSVQAIFDSPPRGFPWRQDWLHLVSIHSSASL